MSQDHVYFVVDPWWRQPFRRDPAYRRHPLFYRIVRKPVGAPWIETELISQHRTWKATKGALKVIRLVRRLATPDTGSTDDQPA